MNDVNFNCVNPTVGSSRSDGNKLLSTSQVTGRTAWRYRLWAAIPGVVCVIVLTAAAWLSPAPAGLGTHQQLGLAECGFFERTGYPCPTCGMTTAFAHMVRGRVVGSFATQPGGALAALACMAIMCASCYIVLGGRRLDKLIFMMGFYWIRLMLLVAVVVLLSWGWMCFLTWIRS